MSRRRRRKRAQHAEKKTNWPLVIGIIALSVVIIGALFYFSFREPETISLNDYCETNPTRCVSLGEADAPATLVEVSDFGCPHCQSFHQETAPLLKSEYVDNGDLQMVFVPYALREETTPAAIAAMCANEQDAYFEFSDALFAQDLTVANSTQGFQNAAEATELDIDAFDACLADNDYATVIGQNQLAAQGAGVSGTPTFFLNDEIIRGAVPFTQFQTQIESILGG